MMLCIANAFIEENDFNLHTIARNFKNWLYASDTRGEVKPLLRVLSIADYVEKPQQVAELIWKMSRTKKCCQWCCNENCDSWITKRECGKNS